ncbi:hypothetical protein HOD08_00010, partial [bacterium]|nr:hypothetical protein [bacterium]
MISHVSGKVLGTTEKHVTVSVSGIGLLLRTPRPAEFIKEKDCEVFVHFHFTQEQGPSLFGFASELEKVLFEKLISCSKIGPGIAIQVLAQIDAPSCIAMIQEGNIRGLSSFNGIGAKKAALIVSELQDKLGNLGSTVGGAGASTVRTSDVQQVSEALQSLGYTRQEIS